MTTNTQTLTFTISEDTPRILTDDVGGCRPANMHEIEMWDLLSAQAPAQSHDDLYAAWHKVGADVAGLKFEDFARALGAKQ